jgi:predicted metal-binding membrane protein
MLVAAAAASWAWLAAYHAPAGAMDMATTMGLSLVSFLGMWVVMMVAMMFPAAAPMILTFQRIQSRKTGDGEIFATWIFVLGYLLLWALTGFAAYALAGGADASASYFNIRPDASARLGGAIIVIAGVYQLTPFKDACLTTCRTPVNFIMTSWRPGLWGAFRMGWRHGLYCFGCCWLFFVLLFPLGIMNIAAMAAITVLIFAEKTLSLGRWGARLTAAILVTYGFTVIALPRALPTYSNPVAMHMN